MLPGEKRHEVDVDPGLNTGLESEQAYSLRTPTGIIGLDRIIDGGLLKGRTYLVAGETGTGKTIFSLRFILKGIEIGEPCVYVPFDETIEGTLEGALTLGWDLETPIKRNMLRIPDVRPFFAEVTRGKFMAEVVREIVKELKKYVVEIGAKRLVIDPVAPLIGEVVDVSWTRDFIRGLVTAIEKFLGCTTIITSEVPTGSGLLSRFGVEEFLSSGIIKLSITGVENRNLRTLMVRKLRWTRVDLTPYVYEIKPLEGIVILEPLHEYVRKLKEEDK
ncbi:MAG: ATPase domain-containing protein [Thermoproteota archaeon]